MKTAVNPCNSVLTDNVNNWIDIDSPQYVLDWLTSGVKIPFIFEPTPFRINNGLLSKAHSNFARDKIQHLVQCGFLKRYDNPICVSPICVVPKKNKKFRLIVDLRHLNSICDAKKFQYEDINTVIELIEPGDFMITVDIKDGFYHIPVSESHQTYLGIHFEGVHYVWTVLPFGLCASPYFFTKTIRPIITYLRSQGLRITVYVDDFLLLSSQLNIEKDKQCFLNVLSKLGWLVNYEKSKLIPSQKQCYIGYVINSSGDKGVPIISVPIERIRRLRKDIRRALCQPSVSARMLARIAGQCISMTKAVLPGKILLRNVYSVLASKSSWEDSLQLSESCIADLRWWLDSLSDWNGAPVVKRPVQGQLTTDASGSGWGAIFRETEAAGHWDREFSQAPSNSRELMAILLALECFKDRMAGQHIQVLTDNITCVAYINHLGGPSCQLTDIAKSIWNLAYQNDIHLSAKYLAGSLNTVADTLSRLNPIYEWYLIQSLFQYLDRL